MSGLLKELDNRPSKELSLRSITAFIARKSRSCVNFPWILLWEMFKNSMPENVPQNQPGIASAMFEFDISNSVKLL